MPHRFVGHRVPWLYAAPLEWALVVILVASGTRFMFDPQTMPSSIANMDWPWSLLFHIMVLLSGLLIGLGLARGKHRWSFGFESVGFVLAACVFITYFGGLLGQIDTVQGAWFPMLTNLCVGLALLVKCRALQIEAKNRLLLLQQLPHRPTTGE